MAGFFREQVTKRVTRSSKWAKTRSSHIEKFPLCSVCGKKGSQVHHIKPFRLYPELELEESNLITFCSKHHLSVGHVGWWVMYNPFILKTVFLYVKTLEEY